MVDPEQYRRMTGILDAALDLPADKRDEFLDDACGDDADLRSEIDRLLLQVTPPEAGSFAPDRLDFSHAMEQHAGYMAPAQPQKIGAYSILRLLGEGGMGAVFLAEQQEPIARLVALKVIHTSLRTPLLLDRFHAERNALARLAHPNVAVLYEAGSTVDGFPFFALEHVPEGEALTRYCDRHKLSVERRLELFVQACRGVQHAHQKGVLHRDLKPSNILVTKIDGEACVKIIDFGLAKSLDGIPLSERTQMTTGRAVGTPGYMSPEARKGTQDLDTRTDVFSLGVMLYECLVGSRPMIAVTDSSGLSRPLDADQIIRPSVQARQVTDEVGEKRRSTAAELHRRLAGDLDWVVLRALAPKPEGRYASASELATDIERHLEFLPVSARSPTIAYQAKRFVRRYRARVAVALAILVLIAGLTIGFATRLVRERNETRREADRATAARAEAEEMVTFLVSLFELSGPDATLGETISARELLDRGAEKISEELADRPATQAGLMRTIGMIYLRLGLYDRSQELIERALEIRRDHPAQLDLDIAQSLTDLAKVLIAKGRHRQAEPLIERSVSLREELLGPEHRALAPALDELGKVKRALGNAEAAVALHRRAVSILEAQEDLLDDRKPNIAQGLNNLGSALLFLGRHQEAKVEYARAISMTEMVFSPEHPKLAPILNNLANVHSALGEYEEARSLFGRALKIHSGTLGADSSRVGLVLLNLGIIDGRLGDLASGEARLRRSLEIFQDSFDGDHPLVAASLSSLGEIVRLRGDLENAVILLRQGIAMDGRTLGPEHPQGAPAHTSLGKALVALGQITEGQAAIERSLQVLEHAQGIDHLSLAAPLLDLAMLLEQEGDVSKAEGAYRRAVEIRRRNLDPDSPELGVAVEALRRFLQAQGRSVE